MRNNLNAFVRYAEAIGTLRHRRLVRALRLHFPRDVGVEDVEPLPEYMQPALARDIVDATVSQMCSRHDPAKPVALIVRPSRTPCAHGDAHGSPRERPEIQWMFAEDGADPERDRSGAGSASDPLIITRTMSAADFRRLDALHCGLEVRVVDSTWMIYVGVSPNITLWEAPTERDRDPPPPIAPPAPEPVLLRAHLQDCALCLAVAAEWESHGSLDPLAPPADEPRTRGRLHSYGPRLEALFADSFSPYRNVHDGVCAACGRRWRFQWNRSHELDGGLCITPAS